jgi:hypothetical protein
MDKIIMQYANFTILSPSLAWREDSEIGKIFHQLRISLIIPQTLRKTCAMRAHNRGRRR